MLTVHIVEQEMVNIWRQNNVDKYTLIQKKTIFLFSIVIYSSISVVLEVKLTKYQQTHPDTAPAAQQMSIHL